MKTTKLIILLLILSINCFSQTKKELESQLNQTLTINNGLKNENLSLKKEIDSLQSMIIKLSANNEELTGKLANTELSLKSCESAYLKEQDKSKSLKQTPITKTQSNSFTIKSKKDISFAGKSKMVYRIILNGNSLPTESEMRNIGISLWKDGNTKWNDFTVFMYLPEMDITSPAYGIGNFNEKGLLNFMVNKYSLYGTKWERYAK